MEASLPRHDRERLMHAAMEMAAGEDQPLTLERVAGLTGLPIGTLASRWPTGDWLLLDAVLERVDHEVGIPDTGSLAGDLLALFERMTACFAKGDLIILRRFARTALIDADFAKLLRDTLVARRRTMITLFLDRARSRGEPVVLGADAAADLVFGPVWYQVLIDHHPWTAELGTSLAQAIARACLHGGQVDRLVDSLAHQERLSALGSNAAALAHSINNLLTVAMGHAELLQRALPAEDPVAGKRLAAIQTALNQATGLTRQVLCSARARDGVQTIDLSRDLPGMAGFAALLCGRLQMDLKTASGSCCVRIDPASLQQVLMNLLANARDAMGGGGRITISLDACTFDAIRAAAEAATQPHDARFIKPGSWVRIAIRDAGPGIDSAIRGQLFTPYATTKRSGHGLGLAMVHDTIVAAGGFVAMVTGPTGTEFTVHLPQVDGPAP